MSDLTDLQEMEASEGAATTLWDPDKSWYAYRAPGDTPDNDGCPPGYGTVYTANGKVCRLVTTATPDVLRADAAPGFLDQSTINIAAAAAQVAQGSAQVLGAVGGVGLEMFRTALPWLVAGAVAYLLLSKRTYP